MVNASTSKPDSSGTKAISPRAFDKLYWVRVVAGVAGGILAQVIAVVLADPGITNPTGILENGMAVALLVYLASFYVAKWGMYKDLEKDHLGKLYSTGVLAFIGFFLIAWILSFTLSGL